MGTTQLSSPQLEAISGIILHHAGVHTSYVIGERTASGKSQNLFASEVLCSTTTHYDIVVFTDAVPDTARVIADRVVQEMDQLSVTILLHSPKQLATTAPDMQWFFYTVLRDGRRLSIDKNVIPYLPFHHIPERDHVATMKYWHKCEAVAQYYLQASDLDHEAIELVKISLLHTAVAFTCLGLIRNQMGYTPTHHSLRFLLSLCSHFSPAPEMYFPTKSDRDKKRFQRLCAPVKMLRHWDRLDCPEDDFTLLHVAVSSFLDAAREVVKESGV